MDKYTDDSSGETKGKKGESTYKLPLDHKLITEEDKLELFLAWKGRGDVSARNKLVECHLRFIKQIALKYRKSSAEEMDDLIQVGTIGLMRSLESYDPELGAITTHASLCIHNEIREFLRKDNSVVLPSNVDVLGRRLEKAKDRLIAQGNLYPNDKDIALESDLDLDKVVEGRSRRVSLVSMDTTGTDEIEEAFGLHEFLPDGECLFDDIQADDLEMKMLLMFECLEKSDRQLLSAYFGLGEGSEPTSLGKLGVGSKQTAQNKVRAAISRLQAIGVNKGIWD